MSEPTSKKNFFTEWLEKLQQESWQLELLIAGFALFGITESKPAISAFSDYINLNHIGNSDIYFLLKTFSNIIYVSWNIFFINLLIHVILRGLWIGAIGLRYVSGDINYEALNYSDYFIKYFNRKVGQFDPYIERLEKLCSVIFAYTFLLFFIFLSLILFFTEFVFLMNLGERLNNANLKMFVGVSAIMFLMVGFIVFIDFITLGSIKRIKHPVISKVYGLIYRFYSRVTLSFVYRPLLYNFLDNKYTRRFFWFSIPYMLLIFILPKVEFQPHEYYPQFYSKEKICTSCYDDLLAQKNAATDGRKRTIGYMTLESYELSRSHAKCFLHLYESDDEYIKYKYGITPLYEKGVFILDHDPTDVEKDSLIKEAEQQKTAAVLAILEAKKAARKEGKKSKKEDEVKVGNDMIVVSFGAGRDGPLKTKDKWAIKIDSTRQYWNDYIFQLKEKRITTIKDAFIDMNQLAVDGIPINSTLSCKFFTHPNKGEKGLLCYFPLDSLATGEHTLSLVRKKYNKREVDSTNIIKRDIPFWIIR